MTRKSVLKTCCHSLISPFLLLTISSVHLSEILRLLSTDLGTALVEQYFLYFLLGPRTCIFWSDWGCSQLCHAAALLTEPPEQGVLMLRWPSLNTQSELFSWGRKRNPQKNFSQVSLGQSVKGVPLYASIWLLPSWITEELERFKLDSGKAGLKWDTAVSDLFNLHIWCSCRIPVGSIL